MVQVQYRTQRRGVGGAPSPGISVGLWFRSIYVVKYQGVEVTVTADGYYNLSLPVFSRGPLLVLLGVSHIPCPPVPLTTRMRRPWEQKDHSWCFRGYVGCGVVVLPPPPSPPHPPPQNFLSRSNSRVWQNRG